MPKKPSNIEIGPDPVLVIWNKDRFADALTERYDGIRIVHSQGELDAVDLQTESFAAAIVLVELDWFGLRTEVGGVDIAKRLRAAERVRFPIGFASFLSLKELMLDPAGNKRLENQILGGAGHFFYRLPFEPSNAIQDIRSRRALNPLQLEDVSESLCDVAGLVVGRLHELQGRLRGLADDTVEDLDAARTLYASAIAEVIRIVGDSMFIDASGPAYDRRSSVFGYRRAAEELSLRAYSELVPKRDAGILSPGKVGQPWKVLILDDEPDSLRDLQAEFERRGIECLIAESVEEARSMIDGDVFNEITVAISDYRLLETNADGVEIQQREQGFDFLLNPSEELRHLHLIALSGLSRRFLLNSFSRYNKRVEVHSKQDVIGAQATRLFVDNVIDRGSEVYDVLCSRPIVSQWRFLRPFYLAHRASADYLESEQKISQRAFRFVRQFEALLEQPDDTKLMVPDLDNLGKIGRKSSDLEIDDPNDLQAFRDKLVGRRIALYLNLKLRFGRNSIYAALRGKLNPGIILSEIAARLADEAGELDYDAEAEGLRHSEAKLKYKRQVTDLLTTNLAVSIPCAEAELLVEERHWLVSEVGISDLETPFSIKRQIPFFVQIAMESFLDEVPEAAGEMRRGSDVFTDDGRLILAGFSEALETLMLAAATVTNAVERKLFARSLSVLENFIRIRVQASPERDELLSLISTLMEKPGDEHGNRVGHKVR